MSNSYKAITESDGTYSMDQTSNIAALIEELSS